MFSIIIPLYNKEQSVNKMLQSVLNQSFKEFEVIIVNDGSTDKSVEKVEAFSDSRIHLIHQSNLGVSAARNKGISKAKYDWIAFLDADDVWDESYLKRVCETISNYPSADVIGFAYRFDNDRCIPFWPREGYVKNYFKVRSEFYLFYTSSVTVSKLALIKCGGFLENLSYGEDLELWEKLAKCYKVVFVPESLVTYTLEAENRAGKKSKRQLKRWYAYNMDFANCLSPEEVNYKFLYLGAVLVFYLKAIDLRTIYLFKKKYTTTVILNSILFAFKKKLLNVSIMS